MSTPRHTFAVLAASVGAAVLVGARGWVLVLLAGAAITLVLLAGWITIARRRGWGSRSTLPRRWDWDAFDTQFQAYAERPRHRRREREEGV